MKSNKLSKSEAKHIKKQIDSIKIHAHSYAFYLNFQHSSFDIYNLLNFASDNELSGIDIHVGTGNANSLNNKSPEELDKISNYAKDRNLTIHLETSSTDKMEVDNILKIASKLNSRTIRVYLRYSGKLSHIIQQGISDLVYAAKLAEKCNTFIVLEGHEVLKSFELRRIVEEVNNKHVNLLFDYGNMINADEKPLDALAIMSPFIKHVHLKGSSVVRAGNGFERIGVRQGEDDLPQKTLLRNLLLLGESVPQVEAFALEQEVGYRSPIFRFKDEASDPIIPNREKSATALGESSDIKARLKIEIEDAEHQVLYVRNLLESIHTDADGVLQVT